MSPQETNPNTEALVATLSDRYRVEREVGRGGMAIVYLAHDLRNNNRKVAIKMLNPVVASTVGTQRFLLEIEIAASLTHPNILSLYESGEVGETLFYVMPYVAGESLRHRLDREKQLPIPDAITICSDVADALAYAHREGIIHRDIKPENILLAGRRALVADFGIARAITPADGAKLTLTGVAVGTPEYMSPEQAAGDSNVDGRTDIYSLGCVLYEMLGGQPPYTGATPQAIAARRLSEPPPKLRTVRNRVAPVLEQAVYRALATVAADRFATAEDFRTAVNAESLGTEVRPASPADPALAMTVAGDGSELSGRTIDGRYRLEAKIGEGGMGQVFRATQLSMGRISAVKLVRSEKIGSVEATARFRREAANVALLNHPNVCTVYDFGEAEGGLLYLAMEFVNGRPLSSIIAEKPLPLRRTAELARQVAAGLNAAHAIGLVHRDLKPDNILIARDDRGHDLVKVVDFGIAKVIADDKQKLTEPGVVIGTPAYMSPEQLSGDVVDSRSDIYSLGVVLFHAVTGELPFTGTVSEMLYNRLIDPPRRLAEARPDMTWSPALQAVFDAALAREPDARPQTAPALAERFSTAVGVALPRAEGADAKTVTVLHDPVSKVPRKSVFTRRVMLAVAALAIVATVPIAVAKVMGGGRVETPPPVTTVSGGTETKTDSGPGAGIDSAPKSGDDKAVLKETKVPVEASSGATAARSEPIDSKARDTVTKSQAAIPPGPTNVGTQSQTTGSALSSTPTPTPTVPTGPFTRAVADSVLRQFQGGFADRRYRDMLTKYTQILPRLPAWNDTVTATYWLGVAHMALEDKTKACKAWALVMDSDGSANAKLAFQRFSAFECEP